MLRVCLTGVVSCALIGFMLGCQSSPPLTYQLTPIPQEEVTETSSEVAEPVPEAVIPAEPELPPAQLAAIPAMPVAPATAGWLVWEAWCQAQGLARPRNGPPGTVGVYELPTSQGLVTLTTGSRYAYWDGLEFWLGFPLQFIQGKLCIFSLDAEKNLWPLATPLPPLNKANKVVVVDAGHGGRSVGTRHITNGRFEKEYTLDWALRIRALLQPTGWGVVLTRTNDADLSIPERVAVADQCGADLFISLHFNSGFPNVDKNGIETYCLTPQGLPSSLVREFADDRRLCFTNNRYDHLNFQYALKLHRSLVLHTRSVDLGVRRARFMAVLRDQNRPAVLIEGGYLSNPEEAGRIATAAYRQKLAEAVAAVLSGL